jgi:arylsulfatase A-like enzyme
VREVDDQIGRLIDQLKAWDLYDKTLIIVTSDHGEMLGDHWLLGKECYFKEAFHIPLIIRDPSAVSAHRLGAKVTRFTESVDLMPTIIDWIGGAMPRQGDGRSLLEFCRGEGPSDWRTEVHWECDFRGVDGPAESLGVAMDRCGMAVIRDKRFQYVHFAGLPALLFDLEIDPDCHKNVANNESYKEDIIEYAQKLLSWRMETSWNLFNNTLITRSGVVERVKEIQTMT